MRTLWILARIRLFDTFRSRSSAAFIFAFPVGLVVVVGLVFAKGHPFEVRRVVVVEPSRSAADPLLTQATAALAAFEEIRVESAASEREATGRLMSGMASAILLHVEGADHVELKLSSRDHAFGTGVATVLPAGTRTSVISAPRWGYVHYLFPGMLTFSVLVAGLFGMAYTLVLYRQNLFLKKLATTPLPKSTFVAAQIGARAVLVLLQNVLLVATAWFMFDMHFTVLQLLWLTVATTLGLLAFMGIGFMLACVIETEDLVTDVISAVNLPLVFLSEIFFPLDALPAPLALVAGILPTTALVRVCRTLLVYQVTAVSALWLDLLLLALWSAVAFAVSTALFRWHR